MAAWVIMPNHVHALFTLRDVPLAELLKAWKGTSANAVHRLLGRRGPLWQEDCWDRYMRDEAHFHKAQRYIESNPVKAGLVQQPGDWPFGSANPKWQWSGVDRYGDGRLLNPPAVLGSRASGSAPGSAGIPARNEAEPPEVADKNVRGPSR
jgi:hypothetical protein